MLEKDWSRATPQRLEKVRNFVANRAKQETNTINEGDDDGPTSSQDRQSEKRHSQVLESDPIVHGIRFRFPTI